MTAERNLLIPLRDGNHLAADLYLPDGGGPHPVLVSYYPYHKDDLIGAAYEYANRYFAEHGYGSLVVDFRGLGNSEGTARPAMDASEAADGHDIVEWTARQGWCRGEVGMWGLSYGGITALRTAAARPPSLRAIVAMMGTHDIYHHWFYPGGCPNLLGVYGVWGPMMLALQLMPPMFHDLQGRWREVWDHRLHHTRPYVLDWPQHREFDGYWTSKVIDLAEIEVPAYLIGGWRDIFPEAMVETYRRIGSPKRLLMGPWLHTQPDQSPFDAVEHLPMMLAFWEHHLSDQPPPPSPPVTFHVQGAGWHQSADWPPPSHDTLVLYPRGDRGLARQPDREHADVAYTADPTVGTAATLFDPLGQGVGLPRDQAGDDAAAASFTSAPLDAPLLVAGSPEALLDVTVAAADEVHLVAKLGAVGPDGRSDLITTGWLRITGSGRHPVRLWATAYLVPAGHRLRLSVACADFPRIWPTPTNPSISIRCGEGGASLTIPTVAREDLDTVDLPAPAPHVDRAPLSLDFEPRWRVVRDEAAGVVSVETGIRSVMTTPSGDGRVAIDHLGTVTLDPARPGDTFVVARTTVALDTPSGSRVRVASGLHATRSSVRLEGTVTVDGVRYFRRTWES